MAYDKNMKMHEARKAIEEHKLFFIEDVCAYIGIAKVTFYDWWPAYSDQYKEIASLLEVNKIKTKSSIRAKLYKSNKAGELLALYKLIGTDEERKKLSQSYHDISSNGETISSSAPIDLSKLSDEALRELASAAKKD